MTTAALDLVITPEALLNHWQGHRRLTRRVIQAFPDDTLFTYSIGGMRPFSVLSKEMISIAGMGIHGIAEGDWGALSDLNYHEASSPLAKVDTKDGLLHFWDRVTSEIDTVWPQIPAGRFQEEDLAFGLYEGTIYSHILYFIENEVHHRGQGYVYLRSLGIEPPFFWERD